MIYVMFPRKETAEEIFPCSVVTVLLSFRVSGFALSFNVSCQTTVRAQRC